MNLSKNLSYSPNKPLEELSINLNPQITLHYINQTKKLIRRIFLLEIYGNKYE